MIKKGLHQISTEHLEGSYFEFGIFEGGSLYAAVNSYREVSSPKSSKFYGRKFNRKFYGFDSFEQGFKFLDENDKHPFFKEGDFVSSFEKCKKRFRNYPEVQLIKGYFEDTVGGKHAPTLFPEEKCAIVFIDCDLTNPALIVLEFMKPIMQKGTIIILDDYFAYGGDPEKGTTGALAMFLAKFPDVKVRKFHQYGYNGMSFIVYDISN